MAFVFSGHIRLLHDENVVDAGSITWYLVETPTHNKDNLYVYTAKLKNSTIQIFVGAYRGEIIDIMETDAWGRVADVESIDLSFHGERRTGARHETKSSEFRKDRRKRLHR
jgi:hypothetical protein